jgi:sugar phosphate isomerase/epimerase
MHFVYFSKLLQGLSLKDQAAFCREVGVDGIDLAVRPGYAVTPDNALTALPLAAKLFQDHGLFIGLVSAPTDLADPEAKAGKMIFEAAAIAQVPAVKIGYFPYRGPYDSCLKEARCRMAGFARLAQSSKVRACYHTHSGSFLGNNAAGLRLLLEGLDPHHVGAYVDTGHTAVNGGPARMEFDIVRPWLSLVAIKDMAWRHSPRGWSYHVVPAGQGIVQWADIAQGVQQVGFKGTVSLHAEYEAKDLDERRQLAKAEFAFLKNYLK